MKKYVAEFVGTCVLTSVACGVAAITGRKIVATSLAFGLVIVAMYYSIGNVSGCHINQARSLAPALLQGGTALSQVWVFILAPLVGAFLAGLFYKFVLKEE